MWVHVWRKQRLRKQDRGDRRYFVPCPANAIFNIETNQFMCCVIKVDRKTKYIYIRLTLPSCVFPYVYFLLRCRMVGFSFAHELLYTTWVKTTEGLCQNKSIFIILLSQTGLKNSTNFVQDRYLRKSLTLPWTRKLSESNSSSVLSV